MLIINADDLGRSVSVNDAVFEAMSRGLVTGATIMANMPGFDDAVSRAFERGMQNRLGVHLVLTEGCALTGTIRACPRFCGADGAFSLTRARRVWRLSSAERGAVR